jgi:hypothetical protein
LDFHLGFLGCWRGGGFDGRGVFFVSRLFGAGFFGGGFGEYLNLSRIRQYVRRGMRKGDLRRIAISRNARQCLCSLLLRLAWRFSLRSSIYRVGT